jgi:DNA-binding MarR family transcriptional regulator
MATIDIARAFADHAIKVERVLGQSGITGNAGRVVFVLTMAKKDWGVSQKEVVDSTALPKDVVSKLVGSLVQAGLLTQERDGADSRINRLITTDSGRSVLSRVMAALQPPRPAKQEAEETYRQSSIFD